MRMIVFDQLLTWKDALVPLTVIDVPENIIALYRMDKKQDRYDFYIHSIPRDALNMSRRPPERTTVFSVRFKQAAIAGDTQIIAVAMNPEAWDFIIGVDGPQPYETELRRNMEERLRYQQQQADEQRRLYDERMRIRYEMEMEAAKIEEIRKHLKQGMGGASASINKFLEEIYGKQSSNTLSNQTLPEHFKKALKP